MKHFAFIILLWFLSCTSYNKYSKEEFLFSEKVSNDLYTENYRVTSYGVGGDVFSIYLTDSISFRKFVMLYYDNDKVDFEIKEEGVEIVRKELRKKPTGPIFEVVVQKNYFNFNELIQNGFNDN